MSKIGNWVKIVSLTNVVGKTEHPRAKRKKKKGNWTLIPHIQESIQNGLKSHM